MAVASMCLRSGSAVMVVPGSVSHLQWALVTLGGGGGGRDRRGVDGRPPSTCRRNLQPRIDSEKIINCGPISMKIN